MKFCGDGTGQVVVVQFSILMEGGIGGEFAEGRGEKRIQGVQGNQISQFCGNRSAQLTVSGEAAATRCNSQQK